MLAPDLEPLDLVRRSKYQMTLAQRRFYHVLKSGCKVEDMQLEVNRREGLKPAIAANTVVAWRILHLKKLSRELPDMAATAVGFIIGITVLRVG